MSSSENLKGLAERRASLTASFPSVPTALPGKLRELIEINSSGHRYVPGMSAEQALAVLAHEAGMLDAVTVLQKMHDNQQTKDANRGKPESGGTHRWPPAGASPR